MASSNSYVTFITEEVLGHISGITTKRMFSGFGVYKDGIIFGFITGDTLYFKVDETNRKDYKERGSIPFTFTSRGKETEISYWLVPPEILEDRDELVEWLEKSVKVSLNAKKR